MVWLKSPALNWKPGEKIDLTVERGKGFVIWPKGKFSSEVEAFSMDIWLWIFQQHPLWLISPWWKSISSSIFSSLLKTNFGWFSAKFQGMSSRGNLMTKLIELSLSLCFFDINPSFKAIYLWISSSVPPSYSVLV